MANPLKTVLGRFLDRLARRMQPEEAGDASRAIYAASAELCRRYGYSDGHWTAAEHRVFSQNGEDGVLAEIFARIGTTNRYFVEFGVNDGRECNTRFLAEVLGWSGLYIEADTVACAEVQRRYANNDNIRVESAFVTPSNADRLFADFGAPDEPDLLSIDIDGQDYYVWRSISEYRPRVVMIEYNSGIPYKLQLAEPAAREELGVGFQGHAFFGASLGALRDLAARKGYLFVHAEMAGVNAFFVREDLAGPLSGQRTVMRSPNYSLRGLRHRPDPKARGFVDPEG